MKLQHQSSFPERLVKNLEKPIIYSLMCIVAGVAALVWGISKVGYRRRDGSHGGLLSELQPIFGTYYGIILLTILLAVLISNRRWIGVGILFAAYGFNFMLYCLPISARPFSWDAYWALSPILALVAITICVYYDWWQSR
ncbi:MAG TPA: hypothetical protein PKD64_16220 [Pirellulaceae bacterium]|nr:hypothetical protein [Pirellulaceae bacterium]HMO93735.1 hypothetical protein [Pirellulaceae bacterium]HMP69929.1 hypothetical protein [Pirellulaceae bacterium]